MEYFLRAGSLDGFDKLTRSLGGNPIELLKGVGLNAASLRHKDTLLPYSKVGDLLEQAATECRCESFGLQLSKNHGFFTIGSIGLYMAQQQSIAESLSVGLRYAYLHARGANLTLRGTPSSYVLDFSLAFTSNNRYWQLVQLSVHLLYRLLKMMTGENWEPEKITFTQPLLKNEQSTFKQFLNCPIEFGSQQNCMMIQKEVLSRKPHGDKAQLQQHIEEHFLALKSQYPNQLQDIIRHEITQLLPTGECSLENISANLGLHPRVLQKKLKTEGATFSKLLEETRSELACSTLKASSISLQDLALQLGYAELSAFSRRFKCWHGIAPQIWRKKHAI